jgi:hypothetical protein
MLAASVTLFYPSAIELDANGNLYVVDLCWPGGVRRISAATGMITNVAGGANPNIADNAPATRDYLDPSAMVFDRDGNLIIADGRRSRVRAVRAPLP